MTRSFGSGSGPRYHASGENGIGPSHHRNGGDEGDGPGHHKGGGDSDQRLLGAKDEVQKLRGAGDSD